jgi:citrate lyase subunit gamma (acyl carrier protein)
MGIKNKNETSPVSLSEATAGSTEKGDVFIRVKPLKKGEGIVIVLESKVKSLYEDAIRKTIKEKLVEFKISDIRVEIKDEAAFDYVLKARLETAVRRAFGVRRK